MKGQSDINSSVSVSPTVKLTVKLVVGTICNGSLKTGESISYLFENSSIKYTSSEIAYIPNTFVPIHGKETAEKIIKTVERFEDLNEVKNVFSNFDIDHSQYI